MLPSTNPIRTCLLVAGLAFGPAVAMAQAEAPVVKVSVAAVYGEDLIDEAKFIGIGRAIDKVDLVARVSGFLQDVLVSDGAAVEEGQLLYRIEPDAYKAAVAARKADLARAEANLDLARIELNRKQELVRRNTAPQSEADVAEANAKVAEAEVQAANAAIEVAELDLSYTEISAPFAGRIGVTDRSVGDIVGPTTPSLATLVRERPMQVAFSLTEKQLINVLEQVGAEVHELSTGEKTPDVFVTLPNGTRLSEAGKVVFVDNRIDPATGTISVRAEFPNERRLIVDGGYFDVTIQALQPTRKVLVPQAAVQRDQRGDFVLIVTPDQRVEQRYVQLGRQYETAMVVQDGVREGEMVIVEGLQRVRPGALVDSVLTGAPVDEAGN